MSLQVDVPDIGPEEVVRVLDDAEKVMRLQLSAGIDWKEDTYDVRSTEIFEAIRTKFNVITLVPG